VHYSHSLHVTYMTQWVAVLAVTDSLLFEVIVIGGCFIDDSFNNIWDIV